MSACSAVFTASLLIPPAGPNGSSTCRPPPHRKIFCPLPLFSSNSIYKSSITPLISPSFRRRPKSSVFFWFPAKPRFTLRKLHEQDHALPPALFPKKERPCNRKRLQDLLSIWYRRPDSNRHGLPHRHLKPACLPIPPLQHSLFSQIKQRKRSQGHHMLSALLPTIDSDDRS